MKSLEMFCRLPGTPRPGRLECGHRLEGDGEVKDPDSIDAVSVASTVNAAWKAGNTGASMFLSKSAQGKAAGAGGSGQCELSDSAANLRRHGQPAEAPAAARVASMTPTRHANLWSMASLSVTEA